MEAPKEERVLIESPEHAKRLLLGCETPPGFFNIAGSKKLQKQKRKALRKELQKKNRTKLDPNSLLCTCLAPDLLRNDKSFDSIVDMAHLCETFKPTQDEYPKILNTRAFLSLLVDHFSSELAEENFRAALGRFIAQTFRLRTIHPPEVESTCVALLNQFNDQLHVLDARLPPFREPKAPKMTTKEQLKNALSELVNEPRPTLNRMSQHIWLGKKTNATNIDYILGETKASFIGSAIAKKETKVHYRSRRTTSQFFLAARNIGNCLVEIPDFEKPNSEDAYREMYYTCKYIAEYIKRGLNVYLHCKAGKGRSVMLLALFYFLNLVPEELAELRVPCELEAIWRHMVSRRGHIDDDQASRDAVLRAFDYIQKNRESLDKITPFEYFKIKEVKAKAQEEAPTAVVMGPPPPIPSREARDSRRMGANP